MSFRNDIAQQDWTCNGSDDLNVLWADWKTKFWEVVNFHAPLRTRRARIKKSTLDQFRTEERHTRSWYSPKKSYDDDVGMIHATGQSIKSCGIQQTRTSRLLKLLIILMLSVNLKVILGKRSKPLTSLLAVAPTIHWMIPSVSNFSDLSNAFYYHFSTIWCRLANDIRPNDNNNMMLWNQRTTSRPYRRRGRGQGVRLQPVGEGVCYSWSEIFHFKQLARFGGKSHGRPDF